MNHNQHRRSNSGRGSQITAREKTEGNVSQVPKSGQESGGPARVEAKRFGGSTEAVRCTVYRVSVVEDPAIQWRLPQFPNQKARGFSWLQLPKKYFLFSYVL